MREWEFHQHRLHHRGSAKFTVLTPRTAKPADETFGDRHPLIALVAVITVGCILGIIGVLYFVTLL